jgi:hypothetical protein
MSHGIAGTCSGNGFPEEEVGEGGNTHIQVTNHRRTYVILGQVRVLKVQRGGPQVWFEQGRLYGGKRTENREDGKISPRYGGRATEEEVAEPMEALSKYRNNPNVY